MHTLKLGSVIITKDEDFAARAAHDPNAPRIVWLRVGNTTNAALVHWLTPRFPNIIALLERGDVLIEVRYAQKGFISYEISPCLRRRWIHRQPSC